MSHYTLKVVTDFASAHTLNGYDGACARMHGHNWKVEAEVEGTKLDDVGMVLDFKIIKKELRDIAKTMDHYYLNDLEPFKKINPTAENIAKYMFEELSSRINDNNGDVIVSALTIWETERACVTYRNPDACR